METLLAQLKTLGCSEREARIYLEILLRGGGSIQSISQRMRENRVTTHSAIERLLEKGYLSETREGRRRRIIAEPPQQFQRVLERQQLELQQKDESVRSLIQNLSKIPRSLSGEPTVRIYRGTTGLKRLLEETLTAQRELRVIIDIGQFVSLLSKEYLLSYYRERARRGISSRLIWPKHPFLKELGPKRRGLKMDVRINKASDDWKVGLFCWDDKIGIKSLAEGFLTCTILQSEEIANFYKTVIFDALWSTLPEIP